MARNFLINKTYTESQGVWTERNHYWDRNTRQRYTRGIVLGQDGSPDNNTDRRFPAYLDQWDDAGTQKNAWADQPSGFFPVITNIDSQYNLYTSPSYFARLHTPLLIVPGGVDGPNGAVFARAWGGENENYIYIMNDVATGGTNYNEISFDGYFADVPPDDYHLTVNTNPQGQTVSLIDYPLTVGTVPEFGARYTGDFIDERGDTVTVNILRKGFSGTAEEICFKGTPVTAASEIVGDDFLSGVMPIELTARLLQTYPGQFDELFLTPPNYWAIQVVNPTLSLTMTGIVTPETSSVEHKDEPTEIELVGYCGMTNMGEEPIEGWSGYATFIEAIGMIQMEYNPLKYKLLEFVGLREANDTSTYIWETLRRYGVGLSTFNGMTPKDALNSILNGFGCVMTHTPGDYVVIQRVDLPLLVGQVIQGAEHKPWGRFVNYQTVTPSPLEVTQPTDTGAHYRDNSQFWGYIPAIGEISVEAEYNDGERHDLEIDLDFWHQMATEGTITDISIGTDINGNEFIKMAGVAQDTQYNWNKRQKIGTSSIRLTGLGLRVGFGYDYKVNDETNTNPVELIGENVSTLVMFGDKCINRTNHVDNGYGYLHAKEAQLADVWETNEVEANMSTERDVAFQGQPLRFWLYGIWRQLPKETGTFEPNHVGYKGMYVRVLLPENHDELNQPVKVITDTEAQIAAPVQVRVSDAPDQTGYSSEVGGVIAKAANKQLTFTWQGYVDNSPKPLREYLASLYMNLRSKDVKRLDATIHTAYPKLMQVLYDPTLANGFFIIQRFTYDFKFCNLELSALEIVNGVNGDLLLEDTENYLTEDNENIGLQ